MAGKLSPAAERLIALPVGKTTTFTGRTPASVLATARRHKPDARYTATKVDTRFVITRIA